jgi:hypothetical protein
MIQWVPVDGLQFTRVSGIEEDVRHAQKAPGGRLALSAVEGRGCYELR